MTSPTQWSSSRNLIRLRLLRCQIRGNKASDGQMGGLETHLYQGRPLAEDGGVTVYAPLNPPPTVITHDCNGDDLSLPLSFPPPPPSPPPPRSFQGPDSCQGCHSRQPSSFTAPTVSTATDGGCALQGLHDPVQRRTLRHLSLTRVNLV